MLTPSFITPTELIKSEVIFVLVVIIIAVFYDVKFRRIPNWLMLVGLIGLLGLQIHQQSWNPLSLLIGLVVGLTFWQLRFIGGGDSKLLALVSAAFVPAYLLSLYFCIALFGAMQSVLMLTFTKEKSLPYAVAIGGGFILLLLLGAF